MTKWSSLSVVIWSYFFYGDVLSKDNVLTIRPGLGLPTKYLEQVMGKTLKQDVKRGPALSWDLLG